MSLEITQFSTYQFAANEALGFHNHILAETSVLPEATTGKQLADYQAAVEELKVLLKNAQGEIPMEEVVKAADKRRDDAYVNGLAYLVAMTKSANADVAAAANAIKAVFDHFPDIRRVNNNTETGVLNNLIEELSAIEASVFELAGFTPWFQELSEAQKAFVEAVHNKNAANSSKASIDLKSAKINCDNTYKALVKRVNALAELEGDNEGFDYTFINNVNAFIEDIRNSKTTKSTKKSDSDDSDESADSIIADEDTASDAGAANNSGAADSAAVSSATI